MSELLHSAEGLRRATVNYDIVVTSGLVDVTRLLGTRKWDRFTNAAGIDVVYGHRPGRSGQARHPGVGVLTGIRTIEITNNLAVLVDALRFAKMTEEKTWEVFDSIPQGAEVALLYLESKYIRPLNDAMTVYQRPKGADTFSLLTAELNTMVNKKPDPDDLKHDEIDVGKGRRFATTSLTTPGHYDKSTRLTLVAPAEIPMPDLQRALKQAGNHGVIDGRGAYSLGFFVRQRFDGQEPPELGGSIASMWSRRAMITH